jgi:Protein of unknown function (DUF4235)
MKLVYKPIGILSGLLAGLLAKRIFDRIWGLFDKEEPPGATHRDAPLAKVLGAAALEGLTFKVTRAAIDRAGAHSFQRVTGAWPGETAPEPTDDD